MKINLKQISEVFSNVEFFVTCFFPEEESNFGSEIPKDLEVFDSPDFWAITSRTSNTHLSLVHHISKSHLIFRGYESEQNIHSYSPLEEFSAISNTNMLRNGVFSYLRYDSSNAVATIRNDALGIAPLFLRQVGTSWWFASHPSLLHLAGDQPDLCNWASMIHNGHSLDDHTFYENIKRVPAGVEITITRDHSKIDEWFQFDEMPVGELVINDEAFVEVEQAYVRAMDRCIELSENYILPLSSGYDSRRFFATLVKKGLEFNAVTCQTFHRKKGRDYDIDSFFAPKIAKSFNVECAVVKASSPKKMVSDGKKRQHLIGTETFMHGWAVPFMEWLSKQTPSIVFDGLAGDTFGNSGYEITGLHENPKKDKELILKEIVNTGFFKNFSSRFPSYSDLQKKYSAFIDKFPANLNQAEWAFLQARTRRAISPWITMMHPPGHVIVFPYCDIDFVRATMRYHPAEKYKWFFQKECLRRFYPEFFNFHGSRNLPIDHPAIEESVSRAMNSLENDIFYRNWKLKFRSLKYLSLKNKVLLLASPLLPAIIFKRKWLFTPLLSLVKIDAEANHFIVLEKSASIPLGPSNATSGNKILSKKGEK